MGVALLVGLIESRWATADELAVVEPDLAQRERIAAEVGSEVILVSQPLEAVPALLAVKPPLVVSVAATLIEPQRVLSVAAGISTAAIESVVPAGTEVVRAMPNTPALLRAGASAVAPGAAAGPDTLTWATELLSAVGVVEVVAESQLDAVTGLSGSGPAYIFLIAEALTDAGVAAGLSRDSAARLAHQTIYGAGLMLRGDDAVGLADPVALRASVTTPAGTTAAGLGALEAHALRAAIADAVRSAAERSAQLGKSA